MKVLVIGKHGQLTRSLAERVSKAAGVKIAFAGRPELDLMQPGSAAAAIAASGAAAVVNAAAYTAVDAAEGDADAAFRINADAAGEIAEAASRTGAPLIHISTDYVFDGEGSAPYGEDAPTNPQSVYGRSKLAGEDAVRAAVSDHAILRTAWLFSPFGRNFVTTIMTAAGKRDCFQVVDDQRGSPTSAFDLADAIFAVLGAWRAGLGTGRGVTYHVASSGDASWFALAQGVMDERRRLGLSVPDLEPIATALWPTPARRPRNSVLDTRRFSRDFGFIMPHWRKSLAPVVRRLAEEAVQ